MRRLLTAEQRQPRDSSESAAARGPLLVAIMRARRSLVAGVLGGLVGFGVLCGAGGSEPRDGLGPAAGLDGSGGVAGRDEVGVVGRVGSGPCAGPRRGWQPGPQFSQPSQLLVDRQRLAVVVGACRGRWRFPRRLAVAGLVRIGRRGVGLRRCLDWLTGPGVGVGLGVVSCRG